MSNARRAQPDQTPDQTDAARLSEAARAVVRDAGDPRIDSHLAALGLGQDPAPEATAPTPVEPHAPAAGTPLVAGPVETSAVAAPDPAELERLRDQVREAEGALGAARRRVRWLAIALAVAVAGDVALLLLLIGRQP